ncbi:MAG: PD-(D/E)XK nuclease family protein, partial [Desulfobacterales bacterium]|nr:PD-(D/E)XK nuclease family protein [Desulfobacterales bacterium]
MKVSGSIIQAWQRCKRAFYFRSPEYGLGFTTAHDNNAIRMGNWGHYCLGLVLKGATYEEAIMATISHQHKLWQQLNVEPPEDYVELETRFSNLMYAHKLWQQADKSAYRSSNLEVLQAEQRWEIEHRGITITGQWDAIVRLKDEGSVFVLERKVTKHPDRMLESAQWDIQPRLYVWAAQQLFPEDTVVG